MSNSTVEDDQRILRSWRIGVVKSEGEFALRGEASQESQEKESAEESHLVIDETVTGKEVVDSLAGLDAHGPKRVHGFGENDDGDSSDENAYRIVSGQLTFHASMETRPFCHLSCFLGFSEDSRDEDCVPGSRAVLSATGGVSPPK